jgi:hypothetical protein
MAYDNQPPRSRDSAPTVHHLIMPSRRHFERKSAAYDRPTTGLPPIGNRPLVKQRREVAATNRSVGLAGTYELG